MAISIKEAAARLDVTRQRVEQLIHAGRIKADKPGTREWIVDEGSVEQYDTERKEVGAPQGA